jgi:hypothetical protein
MFEIRWRDPAIRRRETAMAIGSNPLRSTTKSARASPVVIATNYKTDDIN